jgi:hypothetical protein
MGLPSKAGWLAAGRRLGWLTLLVALWRLARAGQDWITTWYLLHSDWYRFIAWDTYLKDVARPLAHALALTVAGGLAWTVGALVVAMIPGAGRAFDRAGAAVRRLGRRSPRVTRGVMPFVPGLLFFAAYVTRWELHGEILWSGRWMGYLLVLLGSAAATRGFFADLTAPEAMKPGEPAEAPAEALAAGAAASFGAVAVTRTTRSLAWGSAILSLMMIVASYFVPTSSAMAAATLLPFAAAMVTLLVLLRRSKIVVGVDGVWVTGIDRPRHYAYRDHDGVRRDGDDIVLSRQGAPALRLQLDAHDAARAEALTKSIQEQMALADKLRDEGRDIAAQALLAGEDGEAALAAAARGVTDYRTPAIVREHLWELVSGPHTDADTRVRVAGALAKGLTGEERPRLRVAAAGCADPRVRVAIESLAAEHEDEEAGDTDEQARALRA